MLSEVIDAAPKAQLLHCRDGLAMAELGNVCIGIWRKQSTPERFEIQRTLLERVVRSHATGAGYICVIERTSDPPDEDIRKASSRMVTSHGNRLKRVACVIEGSGFRAAITRSVLSGIALFIRTPTLVKFSESVSSAAAWMSEATNPGPFLEQEIEQLRQQLPYD